MPTDERPAAADHEPRPDDLDGEELGEDEEWEDEDVPRPRPSLRRIVAIGVAVLAALLVAIPVVVLTVPAASDAILLPRAGPDLLLADNEVARNLRVELDQPKALDLGLDDSQASRARKAQLSALGFGGGWVRTFEGDSPSGLAQVSTGVSVYRSAEGAHLEYLRTIGELNTTPPWKSFSLGASVGDEWTAYEQGVSGGHAVLVYYRYANLLAQVSLVYAGAAGDAFAGARSAAQTLAQKQVDKQRALRLRP